jgi:hypothetical protein
MIDWQTEFCGEDGYVDAMGYDLSLTPTPAAAAERVHQGWAGATVAHREEGHKPRPSPTARRTSSGGPAGSAPGSAIPDRWAGS